jgi:hypothetical protein
MGPGCQFYFGGTGDDDCVDNGALDPANGLLDPSTLQCVWNGGGGGCGDGIRPAGADAIYHDWAQCYGACDGLAEDSCLASDGCRAIYNDLEACQPDGTCGRVLTYAECVGTAPSGPVRGGDCSILGAEECSRHDDCSAVHAGVPGQFELCQAEPICGAGGMDQVPPPALLRDPQSGKCVDIGGNPCLPAPGTDPNGGVDAPIAFPDWGFCDSPCGALGEADCRASDACRAIYANGCPPNADCYQLEFAACWPTAPSGPIHGTCEGLDAYTCSLHDDCTAEHESDWSGCMDPASCDWTVGQFLACHAEATPPPPPPECATLGESACITRQDCTPLYEGVNCSCSPSGCGCQDWVFDSCEKAQ